MLIIALIISIIRISFPKNSIYTEKTTQCQGTISSLKKTNSTLTIILEGKERVLVTYYLAENTNYNYKLGDKLLVTGIFSKPPKNTIKNGFNYQKYLLTKKIKYTIKATSIKILSSSKNPYYLLKNYLVKRTSRNPYLKAFVLGDKAALSKSAMSGYQELGVSHLLAISGMHITLLSTIILKLLKKLKIKESKRYFLTISFLLLYLLLIEQSASSLRGVLFFIFFSLNNIFYLYIKPINLFIVILSLTLLTNPYYLYDIGFQYSFTISLTLLISTKKITGNYIQKLFKVSCLSFFVSMPITLYNYYQLNFLSILYNLFYVPYVSFIVFPLSLVTLIFEPVLPLYNICTMILEKTTIHLSKISFLKMIFPKLPLIFYLLYILLITYILITLQKKCFIKKIFPLICLLMAHYCYPHFNNLTYLYIIDVGQGDSILLHSRNEAILIDTGGSLSTNSTLAERKIIPFLKSLGIRELKYLILTHGDADHMGEASKIVDKFKVKNVIFNIGEYNYLEKSLIKSLKKKNINYYKGVSTIKLSKETLYFLNTIDYLNENENSSVIYFNYNNFGFLFMGDAGIEKENDLLNIYNLPEIDFLKVGHHGSDTSSGNYFINNINPKNCLISVGKDNKYNHPKESVLQTLGTCAIYRTDKDGSIEIKLNNANYEIKTYGP